MLRRLCTARETKLQLAVSLARRPPGATEAKITSPERLNNCAVRLTPEVGVGAGPIHREV
ncbi:hypothetical protein TPA0906_31490 [Streptomyces olivaceus]|nr:hypothetical protein TPA0906_31490 [Streptomyces olivaceus]